MQLTHMQLLNHLQKSKIASGKIALASLGSRNNVLKEIVAQLQIHQADILRANQKDLENFKGEESVRDRLRLDEKRIRDIITGIKMIVKLPDPLGRVLETRKPATGLVINKVSVPLGVVGVIYESRPNVTVDLAALCLKSGNAAVLKGGKEAQETNELLVKLMRKALQKFRLPTDALYLIDPASDWKEDLMTAHGLVDVLIPRGGQRLIDWVRREARIPTIETGAGVCHTFVDEKYDVSKAARIIFNARTQRPSVCNSLDTLVVHEKIAKKLLPEAARLLITKQVELRADPSSYHILTSQYPGEFLKKAQPEDFGFEFLSQILAIKTVKNFEEGLAFIKKYTSGHSEAILTNNKKHAERFLNEVEAAAVYVNASTRFTDGGEFGMGAEVGVSTQKLHARGPMGLEALTSYKWKVYGSGQVRK